MEDTELTGAAPESTPVPDSAPVTDVAPAEDDLSSAQDEAWDKLNPPPQARDESGRFKGKDGEPAEAVEASEEAPAEPAETGEPETPAEPPIEVPRSWNADAREHWAKMPREAQEYITAREQEIHQRMSEAGRIEAEYRPVRHVLDHYKPYLDQVAHGDVPGYMARMLHYSHQLDSDPAATIRELANAYGVDLGEIWDPSAPVPDQNTLQLQRENARLQAEYAALQRNAAAQHEAAANGQMERIVDEYMSSNPDVKPLFDDEQFQEDVAAEIHAIRMREPNLDPAAQLKQAVERAVWVNEKARATRLEAQRMAESAKRAEAAKSAAAKAKAAASVNVKGAPNAETGRDSDDLSAAQSAAYDRMQAA